MKANALRIGQGSGRITVAGNNFSNSFVGDDGGMRRDSEDRNAGGIVLESTNDIAISGNVFSGLTEKALALAGESHGIVFANNVLCDVESDHGQLEAGTVANNEFLESKD